MKHRLVAAALALLASSGWAGDQGVTPTEVRIGASAVLSGPLGPQTQEYADGSRLYFDHVNASGGVHGRKITYKTLDDRFDVKAAVENTRRLIQEDKVFLIYNNTGTAHTAAILPLLAETRTIVFGPVTGASGLRENFNRYVFHVRAGYANEANKIVGQLKRTGITRVVAFYQDDGMGKALLNEVRKAAAKEQLPIVAEVKLDPRQPDFKAAALATEAAQPQAVIMGTAGTTFSNFVKAVRETSTRPNFYGFSVISLEALNKELGPQARGTVLAQIMPSLKNTSVPVVQEYLTLLRARAPEAVPSPFGFEGFVHARLLVEGLRRAGRDLSTESFIKAMESAGEITFGRFTASYSPTSHNGSAYVELAIVDATGQLRY